jgi:hypothetical protein
MGVAHVPAAHNQNWRIFAYVPPCRVRCSKVVASSKLYAQDSIRQARNTTQTPTSDPLHNKKRRSQLA